MKKLLTLLLSLAVVGNAVASHILATTFTIQYTGTPNGYLLKSYVYRDCSGIPSSGTMDINYADTASMGASYYIATLQLISQQVMPVYTCAPGVPFLCVNGYGIEVTEYATTIALPFASTAWKFWTSECCRSGAISTLSAAATGATYCEATFDNLNFPTNSLPEFSYQNVPIFCLNNPAVYPNTAVEPDGDSIVYSLISTRELITGNQFATNVPYLPPYSPTQFVATSTPVYFDSTTGVASFTPTMLQTGVLAVKATEYRNGVVTGTTMRDINVMIVNGINSPSLVSGTVYVDANNNGTKDVTEYGVPNAFVKSTPFYVYNISDATGFYTMYVSTGPHTVDIANLPSWFNVNPSSYSFNFTTAGNLAGGNDFAIVPVPGTTDLALNLSVAPVRPMVETMVNIVVKNNGSDVTSGNILLVLPDSVSYDSALIAPTAITGDSILWNLPSVNVLQNYAITLWVKADSGLVIGDSVYFSAQVTASPGIDADLTNNSADGWTPVINSFDPNAKSVFPGGTVSVASIAAGEPFTYRIDFENTGTANALTVRLTDILPVELQLESVEVIAASHAYTNRITFPRELEFSFNNINLTPATVDPDNSKGYLIFKVTPVTTLPAGTTINNEARIYFDNNLPILTPQAIVKVENLSTSLVDLLESSSASLFISPNPAKEMISINVPGIESGDVEVAIYTMQGKLVLKKSMKKLQQEALVMDVSSLASGVFLMVVSNNERAWNGRFIK